MNRIFHARITWYHYLFLIIVGILVFYLLWVKSVIPAVICMLILVFLIERSIHTTYTVTSDQYLIVTTGRFAKQKIIPIKNIVWMEKRYSVRIGGFSITRYILIHYDKEKYISVLPIRENEFMELVTSYKLRATK